MSAVVVTYDSAADIDACLDGIAHPDVQVVVVDSCSRDDSAALARAHDGVRVLALPDNVGWPRACNVGAAEAAAPVLAFVNPDARPSGADLVELARTLDDPAVGTVSPRFVEPDGSLQPFYFRFPTALSGVLTFLNVGQRIDQALGRPALSRRTYRFGRDLPAEVDQPGAACLLVRAADFTALGGFPDDLFLFFADTDLCLRVAQRGLRNAVRWDVDVVHRGGASVTALDEPTERRWVQADYLRYVQRHRSRPVVVLTRVAILVLSGLLPAVGRLLRGRPGSAWAMLRTGVGVALS
ncbi:MAG TPA: glycosyltransferase family 2 protein [Mycobacteriales bacterium]|nr:glycosyltransferase family 2 protein [Mycobacteriales bacterium]